MSKIKPLVSEKGLVATENAALFVGVLLVAAEALVSIGNGAELGFSQVANMSVIQTVTQNNNTGPNPLVGVATGVNQNLGGGSTETIVALTGGGEKELPGSAIGSTGVP